MNERERTALILYKMFVTSGMTTVGACAMLGNAEAESAMRCNNVEDHCPMSDSAYTEGVDSGTYRNFATDAYGYGVFQWTHKSRKLGLLEMARSWGTSISDPYLQGAYAVAELEEKFPSVFAYLKTTTDLYAATKMVCEKYEAPAVNNVSARYEYALQYYNGFTHADEIPELPEQNPEPDAPYIRPDISIMMLQAVMSCNGYWPGAVDGIRSDDFRIRLIEFAQDVAKC